MDNAVDNTDRDKLFGRKGKRMNISANSFTRDDAIDAVTKMIDIVYDNHPKEFKISISAGVDRIPLIKAEFEGIILTTTRGENNE